MGEGLLSQKHYYCQTGGKFAFIILLCIGKRETAPTIVLSSKKNKKRKQTPHPLISSESSVTDPTHFVNKIILIVEVFSPNNERYADYYKQDCPRTMIVGVFSPNKIIRK